MPSRLQSRRSSDRDIEIPPYPSARAAGSLVPAARTPIMTSRHTFQADDEVDPIRREAAHPGPNDANSDSIFAVVGWVALGVLGSG
jgi:hypothetical protein